MRYGEWITAAGRHLFRNVNVWVLIAPLLLLIWALQLLGGASVVGMQSRLMHVFNDPLFQRRLMGADTPWEILRLIPFIYARIMGFRLPLLLLAYILNILVWILTFVASGAVIHQTMPGRAERPRWQESLHVGLNRALHIFLIQLLLALPFIVLGLGMFLIAMTLIMSMPSVSGGGPPVGPIGAGMFAIMCLVAPLFLIWGIFSALFRPLAVQACVQEMRNAWEAITTAWQVFWNRLGPVIVLGIILFVIRLFVGALGSVGAPLMFILQNASGVWAVPAMVIWAAWGVIVAVLNLGVQAFGWILYAQAWPELKTPSHDLATGGTTDAVG